MLIAQISDLHCREAGSKASLSCDNNHNVSLAVGRLNGLSPRPDLVIATGDLTSAGRPEQYSALSDLLEPLEIPLFLLPGNHDEYGPLVNAFSNRYGIVNDERGYVRTVIDDGPLRLVALDTSVEGHHQGCVPEERAKWLDEVLGNEAKKPTLIFMHHPPFSIGFKAMDRIRLTNSEKFFSYLDDIFHRPFVHKFVRSFLLSNCFLLLQQINLPSESVF